MLSSEADDAIAHADKLAKPCCLQSCAIWPSELFLYSMLISVSHAGCFGIWGKPDIRTFMGSSGCRPSKESVRSGLPSFVQI